MPANATNSIESRYLEFVIGGKPFVIPGSRVREVSLLPELVSHPGLPCAVCGFFPGMTALHPVLDAAQLLELESLPVTSETSLVFFIPGDQAIPSAAIPEFCLLVDRISGFRDSENSRMDHAPAELCFRGICPEVWVDGDTTLPVLNPDALLEPFQIQKLAEWTAFAGEHNADWKMEPPAAVNQI